MTQSSSIQFAAAELLRRREALEGVAECAEYLGIGVAAAHHRVVCDAITSMMLDDDADILVLLMPPGSGKSSYANQAALAWQMARAPESRNLLVSNTAELAERWGRRLRGVMGDTAWQALSGTSLDPESQAASRFGTSRGGEFMATGAGSAILGLRVDGLCVIDDPHRSMADAASEGQSAAMHDWFASDLMTRLTPTGKVVLIQQRLAWNDLAGYVMRKYGGIDSPKRLKVVTLRMVAEAGEEDPLGRLPGDRLWPEYFTDAMVEDAKLDPVKWQTLYQQHPVVGTNEFCSRSMLEIVGQVPPLGTLRVIEASDFALGENGTKGDFTAHVVAGVDPTGAIFVLDMWRDRQPTLQAVDAMLDKAEAWHPMALLADNDNMVRSMKQFIYDRMRARKLGFHLKFLPTGGRDKRARAAPLEGLLHLRRVKLLSGSWNEDLVRELTEFPVGKHDDAVDCLSLIARHIVEIGRGSEAPQPVDPFAAPPVVERDGRLYLNRPLESLFHEHERGLNSGYSKGRV